MAVQSCRGRHTAMCCGSKCGTESQSSSSEEEMPLQQDKDDAEGHVEGEGHMGEWGERVRWGERGE